MNRRATSLIRKIVLSLAVTCLVLATGFFAYQQLGLQQAAPPIQPPPKPAPPPEPPPKPITLTFVGDIMLDGAVEQLAKQHGTPYLFSGVAKTFMADSLTVGNLECAVSTRGTAEDKTYTFRADPAVLPGLRKSGIEAVTLANNHAHDFGRQAMLDTVDHLKAANITAVGAGRNAYEAYRPAMFALEKQRVALLGASRVLSTDRWAARDDRPGIASAYDPARVLQEIRQARKSADVVVVYFHWGKERMTRPERYQRVMAQQCIDAGADLVIGSHPHVLQGFEYYKGRLIVYSLGNFVFNKRTQSTMMVQATFLNGKMQQATVIPCTYAQYRPLVATTPAVKKTLLANLQTISYGVAIGADGVLSEQ
ncbi:MAG: CapA family protein [Armatimonadota bacterium]